MIRRLSLMVVLGTLCLASPTSAQTLLGLADAVARARAHNLDARAAMVDERIAEQRVAQARAGTRPSINATEDWQRGNQPVYVFGSLLAQRRFTSAAFAIDTLNRPDATNNFRAAVTIEQGLYAPSTRSSIRTATLLRDVSGIAREQIDQDVALAVTEAYGRVLVAAATHTSAAAAVETARADRELAANRRDAGVVTDADVLLLDVHVARARERQIQADADEGIARAQLNQVMGEPLDAAFTLESLPPAPASTGGPAAAQADVLAQRPDVRLAALGVQLASAAMDTARAALLPHVVAQASWEADGGTWTRRSPSWAIGISARLTLFDGFVGRARLRETREVITRRAIEREQTETAARLDVRIATARLDAARAREVVGRTAAEQARESRRIIRDRYEGGLIDVAALLRAAEAIQDADMRHITAQVDIVVATAALERAQGKR